jgi:hypothetical protein
MPTLLELQHAIRKSLVERESAAIARSLAAGVKVDRLDIYRNTIFSGLTKTLRLAYPAVERLVGAEFFEDAAQAFIAEHLPCSACLDQYGDEFPDFLRDLPSAASLSYLADVARLEWAVNRALHAPDAKPLELAQLAEIAPERQGDVSFRPHPSVSLVRADYPVDNIWRAVLSGDDQALATLDLSAGPASLLVERGPAGIEVVRLQEPVWRFLAALCRGALLHCAIAASTNLDAAAALAEHLAAGRFVAFTVSAHKEIISQNAAA